MNIAQHVFFRQFTNSDELHQKQCYLKHEKVDSEAGYELKDFL